MGKAKYRRSSEQWHTSEAGNLSFVGRLSLPQRLTRRPHSSIPRLNLLRGVVCGISNQRFYAEVSRTDPRWTKQNTNGLSRYYCVTNCWNLTIISPVISISVHSWRLFCTTYSRSGACHCPEFRGQVKSIGVGGHVVRPLYRDCSYLGGFVIGGFTVLCCIIFTLQ